MFHVKNVDQKKNSFVWEFQTYIVFLIGYEVPHLSKKWSMYQQNLWLFGSKKKNMEVIKEYP